MVKVEIRESSNDGQIVDVFWDRGEWTMGYYERVQEAPDGGMHVVERYLAEHHLPDQPDGN